jgi:hypothetical protein
MIEIHREKRNSAFASSLISGLIIAIFTFIYRFTDGASFPLIFCSVLLSVSLVLQILWFIALYHWAKAKGYSGYYAWFGLLNFIGIIILACLPDKTMPPMKRA